MKVVLVEYKGPIDIKVEIQNEYQHKIQKLANPKDKVMTTIGYLLIQKLVGGKVERDANERPFVKDTGLDFNISHDGTLCGIVVDTKKVGFDICFTEKDLDKLKFRSVFTSTEWERIQKNDKNFYVLWALKESFVKYLGCGLVDISLTDIEFKLSDSIQCLFRGVVFKVNFKVFEIQGHVLAICAESEIDCEVVFESLNDYIRTSNKVLQGKYHSSTRSVKCQMAREPQDR